MKRGWGVGYALRRHILQLYPPLDANIDLCQLAVVLKLRVGTMAFNEHYVVERTEIVTANLNGEEYYVKIEALADVNGNYHTRSYIYRHVEVKFPYPMPGDSQETQMWVDYDLPYTNRQDAEDAIKQALGFLEERCGHG